MFLFFLTWFIFFFPWKWLAARIALSIDRPSLFDDWKKIVAETASCAGGLSDACACSVVSGKSSDPAL